MSEFLLSFAAAGGAPPASHELLQIDRDGAARALVATPWPGRGRADEAGLYELGLDEPRLAELTALASEVPSLDGRSSPDSGEFTLRLPDRVLRWGPFADVPDAVAALAARLTDLAVEARAHPVAAVRLTLEPGANELLFHFIHLGRAPVGLTVPPGSLRLRAVPAPGESSPEPPPLSWVNESTPLESQGGRLELEPGREWSLSVAAPQLSGPHRLDGFVRAALDLPGDEAVEAVLAAGPVVTRSGAAAQG